jgi:capsular polysaccharide biosynthesis protein
MSQGQAPGTPAPQGVHPNGTRYIDQTGLHLGADMSTQVMGDEPMFSVKDLLRVVWRRLWVVVLVASVLTGAVVGANLTQMPIYAASIKILVGQEPENKISTNLGNDVSGLQQITQTMTQAVDTRPVAEEVIRQLELDESSGQLLANISSEQIGATQLIEVTYSDASPEEARLVANTIGQVFSEQVSEVSTTTNAITATVWEEAVTPDLPVSPDPVRNGLLALAVGTIIGIGLAFLLEHLDDRWRSPEEVEQISGAPTFGVIPAFKVMEKKKQQGKKG